MRFVSGKWLALASVSVLAVGLAGPANAEMTAEARAFLEEAGLPAELIEQASQATDTELDIPQEWLDKAAEEGVIDFSTGDTSEHVAKWKPIFQARYPEVDFVATETSGAARAVQPLMAYKAGQLVRHMLTSFSSSLEDYLEADALEEINDLPGWNNIADNEKDPDGRYASVQKTTWCMSYNKDTVDPADLPATWWDLVAEDSPLAGGRLGAANRAHLWTVNLWGHPDYGPERMTNEFLPAFINNLKPQLRKEGISGIPRLAVVGEYDVALPSPNDETSEWIDSGMPLGFHCPEPVPQYFQLIGMFRGSPTHYSNKILINWMLSQEGQLTRFIAGRDGPAHVDLQTEYSTSLGEAFAGKDVAMRTIDLIVNGLPEVYEVWNPMWANAGGPPRE